MGLPGPRPPVDCACQAGANLPSPWQRNACRDTGHCHLGTQGSAVGDTGLCSAGTRGTLHLTSPLPSPLSSLPPRQEELLSAGELAALAPAALLNQEIAVHKRQLTHLFLNQLLFTPSSVPLAVLLSVPLAADCPLSPARPCSVAAQTAGPGRSRGVVLPSTPHEPTVPSRGRCWGSPSSRGLRGAPGMGSLQGAGFGCRTLLLQLPGRCPKSL